MIKGRHTRAPQDTSHNQDTDHSQTQMVENKRERVRPKVVVDYSRYRNAARAAPIAGHFTPKMYSSGGEEGRLLSPSQFHNKYIQNQPGNIYTDSGDVVEVPSPTTTKSPTSAISPQSPLSALSDGSTRRSQSSLGDSTFHEEEHSSWYVPYKAP
jgi:hypothetical protein